MSLGRRLRSYRIRLPLSLLAAAGVTALVLGIAITVQTWRNVERDLVTTGRQLSDALATAVSPALRHDDVWRAYAALRGSHGSLFDERTLLIVLDDEQQVFAANQPQRFPVATPLTAAGEEFSALADRLGPELPARFVDAPDVISGQRALYTPIRQDGVSVGGLLMLYPDTLMWPRFREITGTAAVSILALMALLAPLGWLWGKRMTRPLGELADAMSRVGRERPEAIRQPGRVRDDEIGQLAAQFGHMLQALQEKDELEARLIERERLTAVGQLAGGVAHEINNPLSGLLLAVSNLRRRSDDPAVLRSADLLERGLRQIQDTVAALLEEARVDGHPLTPADIEDVRTLVSAQRRRAALDWHNGLKSAVPVQATPVRQILLNLLLNAVDAAGPHGTVRCRVRSDKDHNLELQVSNPGPPLADTRPEVLFRAPSERPIRGGFGLWVIERLVRELEGSIEVTSDDHGTTFHVRIPGRRRRAAA